MRQADYLTAAEIQSEEWRTAYDIVQALRPQWLRKRGQQSILGSGDIVVYQDDMRLGGPSQLRDIPATLVVAMRYYDGPSAQQRWGLDHGYGVIQVETR